VWLVAQKNGFAFRGFAPLLLHQRLLKVLQTPSEYQEILLLLQSQTYGWGKEKKERKDTNFPLR